MAKMLQEQYHVDCENGFLCRYVRSNTEKFIPHYHDYYEIFMVVKGPLLHIINSKKQVLNDGNLLFIRDFDIHDYTSADGEYFEFLNLAISKKLFTSVIDYLGDDFPIDELLNADDPPLVALSIKEKEKIFFSLTELDQINNKSSSRLKVKNLLTEFFVNHFLDYNNKIDNIPSWLEITYERMKNPKNFIVGIKRMQEISGKSREHLTRSLQNYYNTSPTEFIKELRLEYAANLLTRSNLPIIDICYNCGFENLSWFYKVFEKKYGTTPSKYRKKHESIKHPTDSD